MRRWKAKLADHGWDLGGNAGGERLTNVRYADDLMLFCKTIEEVVGMVNLLRAELSEFGLEMNTKKTIVFTTDANVFMKEALFMVESDGGFLKSLAEAMFTLTWGRP